MKKPRKPHLHMLWSGNGKAPPMWRCQWVDPKKPGIVNVGDAETPKQAYDYCVNAHKCARYVVSTPLE